MLVLVLSVTLLSTSLAAVLTEYVCKWAGSVGNINLSFNVNEDGMGTYTFAQSGYVENNDFSLEVDSQTFTVDISAANKLDIEVCEGTYAYAGGVLMLAVKPPRQAAGCLNMRCPARE